MARFFFYGTLLDEDVRRATLGREPDPTDTVTARLPGYRVARAAGRAYPVLAPEVGAVAAGVMVRAVREGEAARLFHYEDSGYDAVEVSVVDGRGRTRMAWVFMPGRSLAAMADDWSFAEWQAQHKARVLPGIVEWMAEYAGPASEPRFHAWRNRRRPGS
ncbi:MAG: gamma-glutamylcyclotransferase family protein [Alphaproteobacteria bacterium]